jgi:hypothetical protein
MQISMDENWIRVVDGVLTPEFCDHLIDRFTECQDQQLRRQDYPRLWELSLYSRTYRQFTTQELLRGVLRRQDFTEECQHLVDCVYSVVGDYREHWDHLHSFPEDFTMEGFRIKGYKAGTGDQFPIHTDAGCREMSTRFLAFLFYLNDSDAGTEFPLENITVEARQGRLLMFPPGLQWPHIGHEPRVTDKYILSTYLHFI